MILCGNDAHFKSRASLSIDLTLREDNQYGIGMIFSREKVGGLKYPQTKEGSESPP